MGKAIGRGSKRSVIDECMKDNTKCEYIFKKVRRVTRSEITTLCSNSMLRQQTANDLKTFSWDALLIELQSKAPFLMIILDSCTTTKRPRSNRRAIMGMCMALLLKHCFAKMYLVQKVISLILYAGHSGKKVCMLLDLNIPNFYNI